MPDFHPGRAKVPISAADSRRGHASSTLQARACAPRLEIVKHLLILALLLSGAAAAQAHLDSDTPFSAEYLAARLEGRRIEFFDGSTAAYAATATMSISTPPDDRPWTGGWESRDGSLVCVSFTGGRLRCDMTVRASGRLLLVTAGGLRFPV